jgi:hypothetical protein
MSAMAQIARSAGAGVRIVGIDVNDTDGAARSLLRADNISYPVGADTQGTVADAYRLPGLPTTVFLDGRHRQIGQAVGPLSLAAAKAWLATLARTP